LLRKHKIAFIVAVLPPCTNHYPSFIIEISLKLDYFFVSILL
jgi:hypothetical protein